MLYKTKKWKEKKARLEATNTRTRKGSSTTTPIIKVIKDKRGRFLNLS